MKLERYSGNPILEPTTHWWENLAVFNAACAVKDDRVHLLYRCVGEDQLSRFGLAVSHDGFTFQRRDLPVLEGHKDIEWERLGIEDPRITVIDGRYYITYVAASVYPFDHPRPAFSFGAPWRTRVCLAVTDDFEHFERLGVILPDSDNKDVFIFPEKVNGRYVLVHREFPNMWICYSDDLLNWTDHEVLMSIRPGMWDGNRMGASTQTIKTEYGWVQIYHGVDDARNYHLGICVHDLENPSKIIGRSQDPILSPETDYERIGRVPNVCFSCGAVEFKGKLIVYYGGADTVMAAASVSYSEFLEYVKGLVSDTA